MKLTQTLNFVKFAACMVLVVGLSASCGLHEDETGDCDQAETRATRHDTRWPILDSNPDKKTLLQ